MGNSPRIFPTTQRHVVELAGSFNELGIYHEVASAKDAEDAFTSAAQLRRQLVERFAEAMRIAAFWPLATIISRTCALLQDQAEPGARRVPQGPGSDGSAGGKTSRTPRLSLAIHSDAHELGELA